MSVKFSSDEWLEIVEDYRQSGLSLAKYADQLGINVKTLANHTKSNNPRSKNKGRDVKKRSLSEWSKLIDEQITSGLTRA